MPCVGFLIMSRIVKGAFGPYCHVSLVGGDAIKKLNESLSHNFRAHLVVGHAWLLYTVGLVRCLAQVMAIRRRNDSSFCFV